MSLLLVDRATSDEAKRLFEKSYIEKVVFYFEDACSLFDLHRRWEFENFPRNAQFVLRTRSDLDPRRELGDGIQWMNERFFYDVMHAVDQSHGSIMDNVGLIGLTLRGSEVLDLGDMPLAPAFRISDSDHSYCHQKKHCFQYKCVKFPPLAKSLRAEAAVWKMETSRKWNVDRQQMVKRTEDVAINLFSGKLSDISFNGFPVRKAQGKLIRFLQDCTWPQFLMRYHGRYPTNPGELENFLQGYIFNDWPISDLAAERKFLLDEDEDEDGDDDDDVDLELYDEEEEE